MFRQLDQRESAGVTVTLEWHPITGDVQLRVFDHVSPEGSFTCLVDPRDARRAFLDPFALCAVNRCGSGGRDGRELEEPSGAKRRRRWLRRRAKAEPADQSDDYTGWVRWLSLYAADLPEWFGI
jgi:hypothetical protein